MSDDYVGEDFETQGFDIKELYYKLYGYVGLPFPAGASLSSFTPNNPLGAAAAFLDQFKKSPLGMEFIMPLSLQVPGKKKWEMKTPALISIKGSNRIIRRYPNHAKKGGSIKESWSSDDYIIEIKGVFVKYSNDKYPSQSVKYFRRTCEAKEAVKVENRLFQLLGIERIAIQDYDLPFTQGEGMQAFTIKAYSDDLFNGLLM